MVPKEPRSERTHRLPQSRPEVELPLIVRARPAQGPPVQVRLDANHSECTIGSSDECDLVLADRSVSRKHALLSLSVEGALVRDLGSSNGTFLIDQRIKEATVQPGTTIRVGQTDVTIEVDRDEYAATPPYDGDTYGSLVGGSVAMRRLYGLLRRLEHSNVSVLLEGESGSGKEVVARSIHAQSPRSKGEFVALNCGALDRTMITSELFGHRRGAFTGATDPRNGAFLTAHGGTLFLDEIGELPLEVQPVLLRVLETGEIRPLGADKSQRVDVRLIAATHRNIEEEVQAGRFREDLFYRLAVVRLVIPPLRARIGDIPALVRRFADELGAEVPPPVVRALSGRTWHGNVRELRNAVQAYVALGTLPEASRSGGPDLQAALRQLAERKAPYAELKDELVDQFTRAYLTVLLAECGGNRSEAARRAGIDRSYINRLLSKHK